MTNTRQQFPKAMKRSKKRKKKSRSKTKRYMMG